MPQSRLCSLNERLAKVCDTESSAVWVGDLEIDDGVAMDTENSSDLKTAAQVCKNKHFDVDVVAGDDRLSPDWADLNFDVHDLERLGAHIDLHESWVDCLVELAEARDQSHRA